MTSPSLDRPRLLVVAGSAVAVLVAAALVVALLVVRAGSGGGAGAEEPFEPPAAEDGAAAAVAAGVDTVQEATYARERAAYPDRLRIPDLGVDAPVLPVKAPGRVLVPPRDPQQLGWWADGARPGAESGSALLVGHTVNGGGGALDDLETLDAGARVRVRADGTVLDYEVSTVQVYSKGRIARDAQRLFSQEAPGRLVLLTCEDWDGSGYLSNVVVVAEPV
ncbi:Sortase family protein [Nocardioides dokdonensis FR1436]|uniref:Sortase family protein n=1 Tax=Nocardioides dokdonensis FR1436 TaxID=1300347 RepID=A0A1A9GNB3_9ACTN|nr:class F sortase [Nocardioides dokdonensis]ANH39774.1 Sortase family protein [Nocardioides dokdonensis FR1436]